MVYYKDIALDRLVGLQISYPTVAFREQNICIDEDTVAKISGKVRFFYDALRGLRDESRVVFIDCDTLVLRPLDWVFNSNEFDIAVTWKPAGYPLNSGVLLARSTASTKRFLLQWSEQTQELLSDSEKERFATRGFGGADQFTLATLIGAQRTQNCDVSSTEEQRIAAYDGAFVADSQDNCLRVLGVRCDMLNETESRPISTQTHVVHYKSGWHSPWLLFRATVPPTNHMDVQSIF